MIDAHLAWLSVRSAVVAERLEQELAHQLDLVAEGLFDGPAFRPLRTAASTWG